LPTLEKGEGGLAAKCGFDKALAYAFAIAAHELIRPSARSSEGFAQQPDALSNLFFVHP
jgi:hypothetical protein